MISVVDDRADAAGVDYVGVVVDGLSVGVGVDAGIIGPAEAVVKSEFGSVLLAILLSLFWRHLSIGSLGRWCRNSSGNLTLLFLVSVMRPVRRNTIAV